MSQVTVVGGGIGGLVAAVAAREQSHHVTLYEAHDRLGGRGWTTPGERHANWGPHVLYANGGLWRWLDQRDLIRPFEKVPVTGVFRFRVDGTCRVAPPVRAFRHLLRLRTADAPIDRSFTDWATEIVGAKRTVAQVASFAGVLTFHHDPGSLSAAFVVERLRQSSGLPPKVRYVTGGWGALVDRLADRARYLGVRIETGSRVDTLPENGPVIVAVPLPAASTLLGEQLTWTGSRTALLDVGVTRRRGDPFLISDLDESGWAQAFSKVDRALAPNGEHLIQVQIGMRPHESRDDAITRAERLLDSGYRGWRDRETWRRQAKVDSETGAVDLPGTSWRDRPSVVRGNDIYLVGDMVAAPGILADVSYTSAVTAVDTITNQKRPAVLGQGR